MANRRNAVGVRLTDGRAGVLVRTAVPTAGGEVEPAVGLWGAAPGRVTDVQPLVSGRFDRADVVGAAIVLSDAVGRVQRVGFDGRPEPASFAVAGRVATPLSWTVAGRPELVVDLAVGRVAGGQPIPGQHGTLQDSWTITGSLPALAIRDGRPALVAADGSDPDRPAMVIHPAPVDPARRRRVRLPAPVYLGIVPVGRPRSLVVNLRTGVHTMALAVHDARGRLHWRDLAKGAYLRPPAADIVDGELTVVSDDHGELRRYGPDGSQAWLADWTAAYTLPILGPFGPDGSWSILRAGGIHGLELLDAAGATIWRTEADLWEFASSSPAIGDPAGTGELMLGALTRGGAFVCVAAGTGRTRWTLDLGTSPSDTSIVAADIDGDGRDEFIVGLPDGRLVGIGESPDGAGRIKWSLRFDAAVANPIVVDLDGDGVAELVVATADGQVRWLSSG